MLQFVKNLLARIKKSKLPIPKYSVYLAGPMEYTDDNGLNWRLVYKDRLEKIGIKAIIPNFEETEIVPSVVQFEWDKRNNPHKYIETMRKLIQKDLEFVETADFVIAKWEGERMSGTIGEAQHAYLVGTPNYLVTSWPFHDIPGWFVACFDKVFRDTDELFKFLEEEYAK